MEDKTLEDMPCIYDICDGSGYVEDENTERRRCACNPKDDDESDHDY